MSARPGAIGADAAPRWTPHDHGRRVLVVDDEAHVLRVLRLSLDRNGYDVDTALDGEVALRMLCERRYAALITSSELAPAGRGLCDSVRRRHGAAAPLMLVMDGDDRDQASWGDEPNGVERVERPVSLRWIVARLNQHIVERGRR